MTNIQYVGARYVPKFATPNEWNNALQYEALTIVTYLGNSFTSKQAVPAGVDISNTDYWVSTGNYNAQVEQYRQQVAALNQSVANIKKSLYVSVKDYGAVGDGTTNDAQAFQLALDTGKDVFVPTGNGEKYLINTGVTINTVGQRIFSEPVTPEFYCTTSATILVKAATGFTVTSYFNVFENLAFAEDIDPTSSDTKKRICIDCKPTKVAWNPGGGECTIKGCTFDRFATAIKTTGRAYKIIENEFAHCGNGIICDYDPDSGTGIQGQEYGFRAMKVLYNRIHGDTNSVFFTANSGIIRGMLFIGNNADVSGTLIASTGGSICDSIIANNYAYRYVNLINGNYNGISFTGNIITGNNIIATYEDTTTTRVCIATAAGVSCKGCVISNNRFANYQAAVIFLQDYDGVNISGNRFDGYKATVPAIRTYVNASHKNIVVTGNFLEADSANLFGPPSGTLTLTNSVVQANNVSGTGKITVATDAGGSFIETK